MLHWDVERWLPVDSVADDITALDGPDCWRAVFANNLFIKFVTAILLEPADIRFSYLQHTTSFKVTRLGLSPDCDVTRLVPRKPLINHTAPFEVPSLGCGAIGAEEFCYASHDVIRSAPFGL